MLDDETIREFLIESNENLANLDRELVELEQRPQDGDLIASIFRTIHTIKGTCGFFGFTILGSITHIAENILSQVRDKQRDLTPDLISLVLETVDAVKAVLANIEASGAEGEDIYQDLRPRLEETHRAAAKKPSTAPDAKPASPAAETPHSDPESRPAKNIGELLIENAGAKAEDVAAAVEQQKQGDPRHLGEILVDHGIVQPGAVREALEEQKESPSAKVSDSTIRVDVGLLDNLMNLVGELVLARNQILQVTATQDSNFTATSQRLNLITTELQEGVMKTRMQPIGVVWNKLPRVVRDLAASCGKRIQIEMDGADTELDKTIIEAIKDPLTHIVRNSCDHGIESPDVRARRGKNPQGRLLLRAFHEGGHVNIEISDDGAGIDAEKIKNKALQKGLIRPEQASRMSAREALNLIFLPGLSTAEKVTNVSGRGVGMDVVKTNIEKIGGGVDLSSKLGEGATIKIKIPLTLAIIPGLVVTLQSGRSESLHAAREERFVIPQASLLELVRLEGEEGRKQIESVHGTPVYRRRGKLLPLVYLNRVLQVAERGEQEEAINIVVLQAEDRPFGLVVDGISDTQEIVVKPLGKQLKSVSCYAGATIMGDGRVALILDVLGLGQCAGIIAQSRDSARTEAESSEHLHGDRQTLLLFRTGRFERLAIPLSLVARLEEVALAKIERAAGRPVLHYRGQILPLVSLGAVLDPAAEDTALKRDPAQVVVFSEGTRRIGLVVEQILDIVEESVAIKRPSSAPGLLGSAIVGDKVTDFVDLQAVVAASGDNWLGKSTATQAKPCRVMLVESSALARGMLRNYLAMSACEVTDAENVADALEKLGRNPVDVVVTSVELAAGSGWELLDAIRSSDTLGHLPVVGMVNTAEALATSPARR
jgi:two-component system, chemotaxis family, sensor kinase CheA